jgi:hypothetical protein
VSLPKIRSVWIRSMSQNHRIIRADVCDPARAVDLEPNKILSSTSVWLPPSA